MKHALLSILLIALLSVRATAQEAITIGTTNVLHSAILGEDRTLSIYLPAGYTQNDTAAYPVIYLLDGGVEEDFIHMAGLVQYNTQPWVARFPPSIIVGIENTARQRDFTFAVDKLDFLKRIGFKKEDIPSYGGSAGFIAFIEKELQPWVGSHYRTAPGRTLIGESLAGLLATEILLKHRALFDTYIIVAPSLWWGAESLLAQAPKLLAKEAGRKTKVYVGAPNKTENLIMHEDAVALCGVLKKKGGPGMQVYYDYLPGEQHATVIYQAAYNAFRLLYPKKAGK